MAIAGFGGAVKVNEKKVAEISNWSMDLEADDIDVTSFDSNGWKEYIAGSRGWSGSFEGNFVPDDTEGQGALILAWVNSQNVELQLDVNEDISFSGSAMITLSMEAAVDDKVSFSCDFQGSGELEIVGVGGVGD
jgi:predicted secreted protein